MTTIKALVAPPLYSRILSRFPQKFAFCFAYGSGVKKQLTNAQAAPGSNMIDLIYCVDNSSKWHQSNLQQNSSHYSGLKFLGHRAITKLQENYGAKVYYNTLVPFDDITIKYGIVSTKDLVTDLLEWSDLYLAGRLHKPVDVVVEPTNSELQTALQLNLQSAVHAALLSLPEHFTEYEFYYAISNLSYEGDFRMIFGENKSKVENIVKPQILGFRSLYRSLLTSLRDYVDFPMLKPEPIPEKTDPSGEIEGARSVSDKLQVVKASVQCSQDVCPLAKLHHLNQLPRWPQKGLTRYWNRGNLRQDTEDVLRAIAYDPDCSAIVKQCISGIVWQSSIRQSLKGVLTAVMSQPFGPSLPITQSPDGSSQIIGPTLPPHLLNKLQDQDTPSCSSTTDDHDIEDLKQTNLPKTENHIIGPALPPHLSLTTDSGESSIDSTSKSSPSTLGPLLPPGLSTIDPSTNTDLPDSSTEDAYGPALPPHLKQVEVNSDDEDVYGPLPPGASTSSHAHQALEERALQIKLDQLDSKDDQGTVREEWMMELPQVGGAHLALGPRQFRKNARPDFSDRSSWTDTPEQKAKKSKRKTEVKVDLRKEAELREIQKRDEEQDRLADKHNRKKKRDKSLLELHQDKQKKKKKDDQEEGTTRRPFSREIDLQANQLDDAQKKSIMKKAMLLDDRFSRGQSKFL